MLCISIHIISLSLSFQDLADNLAIDDLTLHELLLTPRLAKDAHGGASIPGAARAAYAPSATFIFTIIILITLGLQWWIHLQTSLIRNDTDAHVYIKLHDFWPRTRTFPLLSLKSYYMNLFFYIFCVDLRISVSSTTLRLWSHSSTAWRALHTHTRIMFFPSMLICHTTAMCFTLSIASPLLYTCSFTQRPKPSGGKGAKSLLKRQRGSAFVSEWAHLKRRKRDWQSLRTCTTYNPSGADCFSYTLQWASPRPLISCAVNDPWSGGHQGIGMSLWNPLLTARHSCTSFTKKCF